MFILMQLRLQIYMILLIHLYETFHLLHYFGTVLLKYEIELLLNKKHPKYGLSESGRKKIFSLIKKHGLSIVYDATEESIRKYYNSKVDEAESFELCYGKIELIINYSKMPEDDKKIAYIGGICKNKFNLKKTWDLKPLLKEYSKENDLEELQKMIVNNEFNNIYQLKGFLQ